MFIQIHEVTTDEERESIYRFRYRIYAEEFDQNIPGMDHKRKLYTDELDEESLLLAAVDYDTECVVGAARSTRLSAAKFTEDLKTTLHLHPMLNAFKPEEVAYSSSFIIDPVYQGKTVASLLARQQYKSGLEEGIKITIIASELSLLPLYYKMGYRPYGQPVRLPESSGLRMPLALIMEDKTYFDQVKSPLREFLPSAKTKDGKQFTLLKDIYSEWRDITSINIEKRALWAGIANGTLSAQYPNILEGFTKKEIEYLFKESLTMHLEKGKHLYRIGETDKGMALIISGRLGVTLSEKENPHYVATLGAGDLCGEMSGLLGKGRTAYVVALEASEVLLLPENFMDKLEKGNINLACRLSRNLNRLLGSRLQATNVQLSGQHQSSQGKYHPSPSQARLKTQKLQESYAIATMADPEKELERLEAQAQIGWELEQYWLRKVGCEDGGTFLDLGAGSGIISFNLAKTFPNSKIIGVEPEPMLRKRASEQAGKLGLSKRCTFLEGTGQRITLDDNTVDYCYARFVLQHIPVPLTVLEELKRVTRPGGLIIASELDEKGVIIHPEPEGLSDIQQRTANAHAELGGDRFMGRKLADYMNRAGLISVLTDVAPITSHLIPIAILVNLLFSYTEQILNRAGTWHEEDQKVLDALRALSACPGSWCLIPIFFAHGKVPK